MSGAYSHNHYVPEWYQKRFIDPAINPHKLYSLDLKPDRYIDSKGNVYSSKDIKHNGPRRLFAQDDLYSVWFGSRKNVEIEQYFFGAIDDNGKKAVEYFTDYDHTNINYKAFENMVLYMSTQKLRTPKGISWLSQIENTKDQQLILAYIMKYRAIFAAIWTECIWQIADASQSNTKFIISDHPITVYNKACGPSNKICRGSNDPEIILNGTHTIFPLSLNKVLILTNLSWARHPYQSPISKRPYSNYNRPAVFKYQEIQINRILSEEEVREINFIIKSRAYRYVAAAKEEWLYPEKFISKSNWNTYGNGYLFMPDPRSIHYGGEVFFGGGSGGSGAFDAFGRPGGHPGFGNNDRPNGKYDPLFRFQGEFAQLFGPYRRGRSFDFSELEKERDSDEYHAYHLSLAKKSNKKVAVPE